MTDTCSSTRHRQTALWPHKLLRWASPFLGLLLALDGFYLALNGQSPFYWLPFGVLVLVALLALIGYVTTRLDRPFGPASFALTLVAVNSAFALAWLNVLSRRRVGAWEWAPVTKCRDWSIQPQATDGEVTFVPCQLKRALTCIATRLPHMTARWILCDWSS